MTPYQEAGMRAFLREWVKLSGGRDDQQESSQESVFPVPHSLGLVDSLADLAGRGIEFSRRRK
jgi:hypothetical protein